MLMAREATATASRRGNPLTSHSRVPSLVVARRRSGRRERPEPASRSPASGEIPNLRQVDVHECPCFVRFSHVSFLLLNFRQLNGDCARFDLGPMTAWLV